MFISYYKDIFALNDIIHDWVQIAYCYPLLKEEIKERLNRDISYEEVKHALFMMQPCKAPGLGVPRQVLSEFMESGGEKCNCFFEEWHKED